MKLGVVLLLLAVLASCHRTAKPTRDPNHERDPVDKRPALCMPGDAGPLRRLGPADCIRDFCVEGALYPRAVPCAPATEDSVDPHQVVVPPPFVCPDKPPTPGKKCERPGVCDVATACHFGAAVVNVACENGAWVVKVTSPCPRACPARAPSGPFCAPHENCIFPDSGCLHASCVDGEYHTNPAPCPAPKP